MARERKKAAKKPPVISSTRTGDRESSATPKVIAGSAQDPFYHSTGVTKKVTLPDGRVIDALDVGSTKPPSALEVGLVSPASGLVITGTERNMAKEREAMNIGYTKEYIESRGGINSMGYFNDTPLSGQLNAAEYRSVTKPDGTIDTPGMARILQQKAYDEAIAKGGNPELVIKKLQSEWGDLFGLNTPATGGGEVVTDISGVFGTGTGTGTGMGGTSGTGTVSGALGTTGAGLFDTGRTLAKDTFKRTLALVFGEAEAAKPWTDELYNVVSKSYRSGSTVEESFNLALLEARNNPNLKSFADRFKGIYALQDMKQAGKPVIIPTIAEYVESQAKMSDIFTQAGLPELATESFTTDLISKGQSVSAVADNIAKVYNRIDSAPQAIKDTLSRYFPTVDRPTLARTLLLGEKGTKQLIDDLAKFEVLAAAEQQGIAATGARPITGGVTEERAAEYARMGQDYGSLMPKFAAVRAVTPEVAKLSGISRRADIGQIGVEQALISGLAQPMEEIQRLGEEEIGRFSGRAGRADIGLASQRRANRAF